MMHKDRTPTLFLSKGTLSVSEGGLSFVDKDGTILIPVGQYSCLFLEPGCSVTHAAVSLCAEHGCLLNWVGDSGVRLYSAGLSKTARTDRLWRQAEKAINKNKRLSVARSMYAYRFSTDSALTSYSLEQLSGMEASRVKETYQRLSEENGLVWEGRSFITTGAGMKSRVNLCVSTANSCLYGLAHAAILAAGYSPAIGFIHGRTPLSFVYDVADLIKFRTVTIIAFQVAADSSIGNPARETRIRCRNMFKEVNFIDKLIPVMDSIIGYRDTDAAERQAVLPPFEFWPYANHICNKSAP